MNENGATCIGQQAVMPRQIRSGSARRRAVVALLVVLAVGLGGLAFRELAPSTPTTPGVSADTAPIADLGDDAAQQTTANELTAAVAAMPSPAPAARVGPACDLAGRVTRPLAPNVYQWVLANCADDQEPHDGLRWDIGPLDRD